MASRDIQKCTSFLQQIWAVGLNVWKQQYPERPQPFLTCTHRSNEEQDRLYAKGRTAPGPKVTNAKAGQSKHNFTPSTAFDIAFKTKDGGLDWSPYLFEDFAKIVEPMGVMWGGRWGSFVDRPHFEQDTPNEN